MLGFDEFVAATAVLVALSGIAVQAYQSLRLSKARFILEINDYLNDYADARRVLKNQSHEEIIGNLNSLEYERVLDYLTSFENLNNLHDSKIISLAQISDYFGGRFFEAMESSFVQNSCEEDWFSDSYKLLYALKRKLQKNKLYPIN